MYLFIGSSIIGLFFNKNPTFESLKNNSFIYCTKEFTSCNKTVHKSDMANEIQIFPNIYVHMLDVICWSEFENVTNSKLVGQ